MEKILEFGMVTYFCIYVAPQRVFTDLSPTALTKRLTLQFSCPGSDQEIYWPWVFQTQVKNLLVASGQKDCQRSNYFVFSKENYYSADWARGEGR